MDAPISVIIPCYRCAETIARAVDSVARQTLRPAKIIIVDDGSGDGTLDVLKSLQSTYGDTWIDLLALDRNHGVSYARNAGWDRALQEYIAFLDADDVWHPQKIELQYRWMREHPDFAMVGHDYLIIAPSLEAAPSAVERDVQACPVTRKRILFSNPFVTPSVMLKRGVPYRFDPTQRYCEDYALWLRLIFSGCQVALLKAPLVYVHKEIGVSGASRHLLRMRLGDMRNYWRLWRSGELGFVPTGAAITYSFLKFMLLLIVGPKLHYAIKQRVEDLLQNPVRRAQ